MTHGAGRIALVTGVTGYIGSRLVPELLTAGWKVRVLTRSPDGVATQPWADQVEVVTGDANDPAVLDEALDGAFVAYYLLHSMDGKPQFERRDRALARGFAAAARRAAVHRRPVGRQSLSRG